MASTGYNDMKDFTVSNKAISDLRDLIDLSVLQKGTLAELITLKYNIRPGDKLGFLGQMNMVGENKGICKPTWNATGIPTQEKEWATGPFMITEELCAADWEETIAEYCLNSGTDRADLTNTDLLNIVIFPKLEEAILNGIWRVVWHGDTAFEVVADGGIFSDILAGDDLFFNMCDGLWKRLFAAVPTASPHHVVIEANAEATKALQMSSLFTFGKASAIFRDLIYKADMRLRQQTDKAIVCTQTLADALANDLKTNNIGSSLQWESLFGGLVSATMFNGVEIIAVPKLDEMIQAYNDLGATYYNPHRAIFCSKRQLLAGFQGESIVPDLDVFFSKDDQVVRMLARTEVGTQTIEDDMISMAY